MNDTRNDIHNVEADPRFKQCNREFMMILGLWAFNIVLVVGLIAWLGQGTPADEMTFTFGLPDWYIWGALGGSFVFCVISTLVVRFFFREMPLDGYPEDDQP